MIPLGEYQSLGQSAFLQKISGAFYYVTLLIYLSFSCTHKEHAAKLGQIAESEYKKYGITLYKPYSTSMSSTSKINVE